MMNGFIPDIRAKIIRKGFLYLFKLAASILLSACVGPSAPQAQNPKPQKREYVVYRIDDHRYITIESRYPCINGQIDGEIYYYDTRQNIRTPVAYTGDADNGLYRGYYAIHADSSYVAIPSLSFSQTSGMMLRINYSRDGGRSFKYFTTSGNDRDGVIILDGNILYLAKRDRKYPNNYSDDIGFTFNIQQEMNSEFAKYSFPDFLEKYGKIVENQQVPFATESPSKLTHWICPSLPEN
jgi:hypothetical protein